MNSRPLVSILMPVYNADRWLPAALESAFAQTFEDFEIVAVDDGSTDASRQILDEWSRREPRLRVAHVSHGGLPRAREVSLLEARGRYAAFLDADDQWLPHRLERQLPYVDAETVVFADAYLTDEAGTIHGTYADQVAAPPPVEWPATDLFGELLSIGSFIPVLTVLAPVQLLIEAGSFRRAERAGYGSTGGACDFEMWLLLSLRGTRFQYVDEPLGLYRGRSNSLSQDTLQLKTESLRIFRSLESEVRGERLRQLRTARLPVQRYLEVAHRKRGWASTLDGDRPGARTALRESLAAHPRSARAWLALVLSFVPPLARRAAVRGTAEHA